MTNIQDRLHNVNVASSELLATPEEIKQRLPLTARAAETVFKSREILRAILERRDPRLFIVVGPCSIHDVRAAREYAAHLKGVADQVASTMLLIMRVYFEKPRTTVGWKGLINDPDLDDSFQIEKGILLARELLLYVAELGLPAGTEALDPIMPQYLSELITWTAIGARTTESQTHREMASGLSTPVGFKNGTDGALATSINALQSVRHPHHFLGITQQGQSAVFRTRGNPHAHIVLRGGGGRVNYDAVSIALAERQLLPRICPRPSSSIAATAIPTRTRACSHWWRRIASRKSSTAIARSSGLMLESHLKAGNQPIPKDLGTLEYGVSITDPCIDWQSTETLLLKLHRSLQTVQR